jgi:hypothetical protein
MIRTPEMTSFEPGYFDLPLVPKLKALCMSTAPNLKSFREVVYLLL